MRRLLVPLLVLMTLAGLRAQDDGAWAAVSFVGAVRDAERDRTIDYRLVRMPNGSCSNWRSPPTSRPTSSSTPGRAATAASPRRTSRRSVKSDGVWLVGWGGRRTAPTQTNRTGEHHAQRSTHSRAFLSPFSPPAGHCVVGGRLHGPRHLVRLLDELLVVIPADKACSSPGAGARGAYCAGVGLFPGNNQSWCNTIRVGIRSVDRTRLLWSDGQANGALARQRVVEHAVVEPFGVELTHR